MTDVTLDGISIGRARGKKTDYVNAKDVKETNVRIGELVAGDKKKK